jgi:dCTP deaminase
MAVLSAQSIHKRIWRLHNPDNLKLFTCLDIDPWEPESKKAHGLSYGLTAAGYDIRLGEFTPNTFEIYHDKRTLKPGDFMLCASLERIKVPVDLQVIVHDKSTWARQGLALQNTVLEPGWEGHITLELSNHGKQTLLLYTGMPIAQLIFHQLDQPTNRPYVGKYQNQEKIPVRAIFEEDSNAS